MKYFVCQPVETTRLPFVIMLDPDAADRLETNLASARASGARIRQQLVNRALAVAFGEVCEVSPITAREFFATLGAARDANDAPPDGGQPARIEPTPKPRKPRGGLAARMQAAGVAS